MNLETYLTSTSGRTFEKDSAIHQIIDTDILKEIGDVTRKLEKTRNTLHSAGDIIREHPK